MTTGFSRTMTSSFAVLTMMYGGCAAEVSEDPQTVGTVVSKLAANESCLEGIDSTDRTGPFRFSTERSGRIRMYVPQVPDGCRVPVVHLANGTGASCRMYNTVLESLASHGFLAACYDSSNTGAGDQGMEAIAAARSQYSNMVSDKIGSTGHSQGGQAAFVVLSKAEDEYGDSFTYAGLAMQPASGFGDQPRQRWQTVYSNIDSPMFMFSGSRDILVSGRWVQRGFDALDSGTEAYYWEKSGSTHIPVPNSETVEVGIPWFRWKLLGDRAACEAFYNLRNNDRSWSVEDEQNTVSCSETVGGGDSGGDSGSEGGSAGDGIGGVDGGGSSTPWWAWWRR